MLLALVYFAARCVLQLLVSSGRADLEREAELFVLRHQVKVLSRGVRPPPFRRGDRTLPPAASRILPRHRWKAFVVTPRTLLRWHRSSFAASGRIAAADRAGRVSIRKQLGSSCASRAGPPGGVTSGSAGSS